MNFNEEQSTRNILTLQYELMEGGNIICFYFFFAFHAFLFYYLPLSFFFPFSFLVPLRFFRFLFVPGLFNNVVGSSYYIASNNRMINE